ncbi:transporter substrate-binding domain-containing protein [Microbulbifer litoralis]|uniref:transporter substrate-binding domain-containing protein n=1 Tax=Microbulbifer litoralis TaxID=2933965 RepID=UPI002027B9CC|nr:transporter substrate-binding domain-containing protein [Microbulbifer sp. GX H0434]
MPNQRRTGISPLVLFIAVAIAAALFAIRGCDDRQRMQDQARMPVTTAGRIPSEEDYTGYIETGDLKEIRKRGTIRYVNLVGPREDALPRAAVVTKRHFDLANRLAKRLKLEPQWIQVHSITRAIELIRSGRADIMADNFSVTEARRELIDFSTPIFQTYQILVTGPSGPDISDPNELRDVEFIVPSGSTQVDTARRMIRDNPDANLSVTEVDLYGDLDQLMDAVNEKPNRVAILQENIAGEMRHYRDDVELGARVSDLENIAWGMRKDARRLQITVNNFLTQNLVKGETARIADWKAIKRSGLIRLLTYNSPTSYFIWKGALMGFDYDLARTFAARHGLELQVVVVPFEEELIDWLKQGRGDFAGSGLTITKERIARGIAFTTPYLETPEQIISHSGKPKIETIQDLDGRTLTVRAHSSFIKTAQVLRDSGIDVQVEIANPEISYSQIFSMVDEGELDASIADSNAANVEAALRTGIITGTLVSDPRPQGWMVLPEHRELLKQLDKFLKKFKKSPLYEETYNRYFKPNKRFQQKIRARIIPGQDLSPYDELAKSSSEEFRFDWRLVIAQMWQESNFNPKAVSPVGAQGLMQLMPATAEDMGFPPPVFEPDRNIMAGVKYLNWVRGRFDPRLPAATRLWFTLASYNAGYGHLLDAQRLAKELGLDPDIWFDNVETAMLKLSEPRYFKKARYGYVRGAEPVAYVRKISNLYKAYVDVASGESTVDVPLRKNHPGDTAETEAGSGAPSAREPP